MKKTVLFLLIFLVGFGNFAYASASLTCGSMMNVAQPMKGFSSPPIMPCCKSHPCDCAIKAAPIEVTAILSQASFAFGWALKSSPLLTSSEPFFEPAPQFYFTSEKSPPDEQPLYDLYSVYRI
jgi:hypothetical protein